MDPIRQLPKDGEILSVEIWQWDLGICETC